MPTRKHHCEKQYTDSIVPDLTIVFGWHTSLRPKEHNEHDAGSKI